MANPSQIFRLDLKLDTTEGVHVEDVLRVARHPSETLERMVLRILAYCYYYKPGIQFGRGICVDDEPDVGINEQGYWTLWIETGLPRPERLQKIARRADRTVVWVAEEDRRITAWRPSRRDLPKKPVEIALLEPASIRQLAGQLDARLRWHVRCDPDRLDIRYSEDIGVSVPVACSGL